MTVFARAAFLAAAARREQFPPEGPPEIAFLGRSNVGKSSAVSALAGRRRLAFASKSPGRTRTANFFDLGGLGRLVDLPGYGYARAPQAERERWRRLVGEYVFRRRTLAGLVLLMDARHAPAAADVQLLRWLEPLRVPRLVLLTKSDKLGAAERSKAIASVRAFVSEAILFSSTDRLGLEETRGHLVRWLHEGSSAAGNKKTPGKGELNRGQNALMGIKAPAQGGEAGDDQHRLRVRFDGA